VTYFGLAFFLCLPPSGRSRLVMLALRILPFRTLRRTSSL
jgi:hypothetical protein